MQSFELCQSFKAYSDKSINLHITLIANLIPEALCRVRVHSMLPVQQSTTIPFCRALCLCHFADTF